MLDETPLRQGRYETVDGVRLLRPNPDIPYRDGAEERILELVRQAKDVSSDSTEILELAKADPFTDTVYQLEFLAFPVTLPPPTA